MDLIQVKGFLKEDIDDTDKEVHEAFQNEGPVYAVHQCLVLPILHNPDQIILQFNGWSINLHDDGTWEWEDTTGG